MSDFSRARRFVVTNFQVKLHHWQQLPWILFGIAHYRSDVARACARRGLALAAAGAAGYNHWLALTLCMPGSTGYSQLVQFVQGTCLDVLPFLKSMAGRLRVASVSERWVESRHAKAKRILSKAHHRSAVHLAFMACQHAFNRIPSFSRNLQSIVAQRNLNPVWSLRWVLTEIRPCRLLG